MKDRELVNLDTHLAYRKGHRWPAACLSDELMEMHGSTEIGSDGIKTRVQDDIKSCIGIRGCGKP